MSDIASEDFYIGRLSCEEDDVVAPNKQNLLRVPTPGPDERPSSVASDNSLVKSLGSGQSPPNVPSPIFWLEPNSRASSRNSNSVWKWGVSLAGSECSETSNTLSLSDNGSEGDDNRAAAETKPEVPADVDDGSHESEAFKASSHLSSDATAWRDRVDSGRSSSGTSEFAGRSDDGYDSDSIVFPSFGMHDSDDSYQSKCQKRKTRYSTQDCIVM